MLHRQLPLLAALVVIAGLFVGNIAHAQPLGLDLNSGGDSFATEFVSDGTTVWFRANDGLAGEEIHELDLVDGTTSLLSDLNPGVGGSDAHWLTFAAGRLFVAANDNLYAIDPSDGTFTPVAIPSSVDTEPSDLVVVGDQLILAANTTSGREIVHVDATDLSIVAVTDIDSTGDDHANPAELTVLGNDVYFRANDGGAPTLWQYNVTSMTATEVADMGSSANVEDPYFITAFAGLIVVRDNTRGELAVWDPSAQSVLLIDLWLADESRPTGFHVDGNELYVAANSDDGRELVVIADDLSFTLQNLNASGSSNPSQFVSYDGSVCFGADIGPAGRELNCYQSGGLSYVGDVNASGDGGFHFPIVVGSLLLFRATDDGADEELFTFDSTGPTVTKYDLDTEGSGNPTLLLSAGAGMAVASGNATGIGRELIVWGLNLAPTDILPDSIDVDENTANSTVVALLMALDPNVGDTHTFALTDSAGGTFTIANGDELTVLNNAALDFETNPTLSVTVEATDSGGLTLSDTIAINVQDVNEAPTNVLLSNNSVDENANNAVVGILSATDPDIGDNHVYAITGGTHGASFQVVGNELRTMGSLDFETLGTPLEVTIQAMDSGGLTTNRTFSITLNDINEVPTDITLDNQDVDENVADALVGNLGTVDPDVGDSHTYSLAGGLHSTSFQIVGDQLRTNGSLDFETLGSPLTVNIRTTDSGGLRFVETFQIVLNDVNDPPTAITLDNDTIPENGPVGVLVGTLSTVDQDTADSHTYSLTDSTGTFEVVGDEIRVLDNTMLDHEGVGSITVTVTSTDSGGAGLMTDLTITITDRPEPPTDITLDNNDVDENLADALVGVLSATDPDVPDSHTWAILPGANGNLFQIVGDELRTNGALDFEVDGPAPRVVVQATDSAGLQYAETLSITLNDVNDFPSDIVLDNDTVEENLADALVGNLTTVDQDSGDTHTYQLAGGLHATSFQIVGDQLRTNGTLDFETLGSPLTVNIRTFDAGGLRYVETFQITLIDTNDPPTDITLDDTTVDENSANGTVVGTFTTIDPDSGDGHTYTVNDPSGTFTAVGDELHVLDNTALNFEANPSFAISVTSTDSGGAFTTVGFTIDVLDVNEAPTGVTLNPSNVVENAADDTLVGTLSTADPDTGESFTYSLDDDASGRFYVDGRRIRVADGSLLDFESQTQWTVRVRTTDSGGLQGAFDITIDVTNLNEPATSLVLDNNTVPENSPTGTVVGTLTATDPEPGDSHSYSILDDAGGRFQVVGDEVQVADGALLDFEVQTDFNIVVRAIDDGSPPRSADFVLTIDVTDANDPPTAIALAGTTVDENAATGTPVGVFSTTDQDAGDSHQYLLLDDAGGAFAVNGDTLEVADSSQLDYESAPQLTIEVLVRDTSDATTQQTFVIDLRDVNEVPTGVALSPNTADEGAATDTLVGTLTAQDPDAGDSHTFALVDDAGGRFQLVGDTILVLDGSLLDFEDQPQWTIQVSATDAGGLSATFDVVIDVVDANEAPTGVTLAPDTVPENSATGVVVGTFTAQDPDAGDTHTFSLADDAGGRFQVAADQLQVADGALLDFESQPSWDIVVTVTDDHPTTPLTANFTVTVTLTDANDAPSAVALDNRQIAEDASSGDTVGVLTTTDEDAGDNHTYTLVDDAGGAFTVVGDELRVDDASLLDFETQPQLTVRVQSTDSGGESVAADFTIDLIDVNEAPTALALDPSAVLENSATGKTVGTLTTTDQDAGDSHTYNLVDDAGGRFQLAGDELQVADGSLLDFETQAQWTVRVEATDSGGLTVEQDLTIDVLNANDAPTLVTIDNDTIDENSVGGLPVGQLTTVDPDPADSHTYTLVDDAGGRFVVAADTLFVNTGADLNFETQPSWDIVVRTTDDGSPALSFDQTITILLTDLNEPPTSLSVSSTRVDEGAAPGTFIGTLTNNDPDAGDTQTYSLVDDAGGAFQIVGDELVVADGTLLDFEGLNPVPIVIRVEDADGLFLDVNVDIDVLDINEAPSSIVLTPGRIDENAPNGTSVGRLSSADQDGGDSHTYALDDDAGGRFQLSGSDVLVADTTLIDFEVATSHTITVTSTDSGGLSVTSDLTIDVTDVNEAPNDIALSNDQIGELAAVGSSVGTLSVTDPDNGDTHTLTLIDDAGGAFVLVGNDLQTATALDFESQPVYSVTVRATDAGGLSLTMVFAIDVLDENEAPLAIALAPSSIDENSPVSTVVGSLTTTDPDNADSHTYTLDDDAGGALALAGADVVVSGAIDRETTPTLVITVTSTDSGGLQTSADLTIDVGDVNEAPTGIAIDRSVISEDATDGAVVGRLTTADEDVGDIHTYTLDDDAGGRFAIDANQLVVANAALLDPTINPSHDVIVRSTDSGGLDVVATFTITVLDENSPPTDIALTGDTVVENATNGTVVGDLSTTDPDTDDVHIYNLLDDASGRFTISGAQLTVLDGSLLDFETAASHQIEVESVDAGGLTTSMTFTITVLDDNDAPSSVTLSNSSVAEGSPTGTAVGTLTTVDQDPGDSHTYTLSDDASGRFVLNGDTVEVADGTLLDFETAPSHDIVVISTDSGGAMITVTLTIDITDVGEAPTDISLDNAEVAENSADDTVVGTLSTADGDIGDTFTYTLTDDANGRFAVVGDQLQVADGSQLDFETNSLHTITVQSNDGTTSVSVELEITVTDVNEAPSNVSLSRDTVAEGATNGSVVGVFSADDPDLGEVLTWSLAVDAGGRFAIDRDQLVVADTGQIVSGTTYDITVVVTDSGGLAVSMDFTITATDVNQPPTDVTLDNNTVVENAADATLVGNLSTIDPDVGDIFFYSLADDAQGRFEVMGDQVVVAAGASLDYEAAVSHDIQVVSVDSGGLSITVPLTIDVIDVDEAPTIGNDTTRIDSAATAVNVQIDAADPEGGPLTYSAENLPPGLTIDPATGLISGIIDDDADDGSPYTVTVTVSDGENQTSIDILWTVTPLIDSDSDGASDDCETMFGFDPNDPTDGPSDPDGDGQSVADECRRGTDPSFYNGPSAPVVLSPEIDAVLDIVRPELVVENATDPDDDALTYTFELYSDEALTTLVTSTTDVAEMTDTTLWAVDVDLDDGPFYWRAAASDAYVTGPWSDTGSFSVDSANDAPSVPTLIRPTDESSADSVTPELEVEVSTDPEGDAITYLFEVYSDEALGALADSGESSSTTYTVTSALEAGSQYWWRAAARDDQGATSEFSEPWTFTIATDNSLPAAPVITAPTDGAVVPESTVDVVWLQASDEDGDVLTYEIELATDASFSSVVESETDIEEMAEMTRTFADLAKGATYWVRVRAHDALGAGPFATISFTIAGDNQPPTGITLISPEDGAIVTELPLVLEFQGTDPDDNELAYTVTLYGDAELSEVITTFETGGLSGEVAFVTLEELDPEITEVWWQVVVTDPAGGSLTSTSRVFAIDVQVLVSATKNDDCDCTIAAPANKAPIHWLALAAAVSVMLMLRRRR